jgi:hypothetical protein
MNSSFLLQYVPRVLRIYFSCKELEETPQEEFGLWVKGVFTFFLYILASHVSFYFINIFFLAKKKLHIRGEKEPSGETQRKNTTTLNQGAGGDGKPLETKTFNRE